jgi:competence protein ComEA
MKTQLKNYMSLTKKEWNGISMLLILIALVLAAPYVYQWFRKDNTININEFNAALAQLNKANQIAPSSNTLNDDSKTGNVALFKFNPNNLSAADWRRLGLSGKQTGIIKNYEAKGGAFRRPEDLKKIYGITPTDYARLAPYINIPANEIKASAPAAIIELNTADSAKLTTVQGIGPAFARRIIYYRERLGGFIAKEQLKEVYGLDVIKYSEIKDQLKVDSGRIHKMNINTITFDKLRLMPYLNYKQVNAIIEYRKQHGDYTAINDLKNIAIIDEVILRKIEPYLIF